MIQFPGTHSFTQGHQAGQRNHGLIATAYKNFVNILWCRPSAGRRLHQHIVLLSSALVACHRPPAQHGLHRAGHHIHRDTEVSGAGPVDVHEDLRFVELQVTVRLHNARVLLHLSNEFLGNRGHVGVGVAADEDIIDRAFPKALTETGGRHWKGIDTRKARQSGEQVFLQLLGAAGPLTPIHRTQHTEGVGDLAATNEHEAPIKLRVLGGDRVDRIQITCGVVQGCSVGGADRHGDHTPVFVGSQLALGRVKEPTTASRGQQHHGNDEPAPLQRPGKHLGVARSKRVQGVLHEAVKTCRLRHVAQQLAAHHRGQRKGHEARDQHGARQGEGKFSEQSAGTPRSKGQWCKHGS